MVTPVQTWGSMGSMVEEQKLYGAQTSKYLESMEVHDLFGHMLQQVLIQQPMKPLKFLQELLKQMKEQPKFCCCVMGPPGISRSKFSAQIAGDFKVKHVHVGKLLRSRRDVKDVLEAGDLVEDSIVIDMVKAELVKTTGGWVLDGFPRTRVQALALANIAKEAGASVDSLLLLNTTEDVIRERYAAKVVAAGFNPADKEDLINMRLQQYHRHVLSVVEVFQNAIRTIDVAGEDDTAQTYETIRSCLHVRPFSNAPFRMHRICITGPCASGRSTQSKEVAKQFGLVHVDVADLVRKHQEASGLIIEDVALELLSDEELCGLVGARLNQADCKRKGWVLDGFPLTKPQAEFLRQAHLWPSRVFLMGVSLDTSLNRIGSRRIDPTDGKVFYETPTSLVLRERLIHSPQDQPEKVKERFRVFADNKDIIIDSWKQISTAVPGESNPELTSKGIFEKITSPLQFELAQAPK